MAVNLSAVFRVRDQGTSVLRRISQTTNTVRQSMRSATTSINGTQRAMQGVTSTTTATATAMSRTQRITSTIGNAFRGASNSVRQFSNESRSASNASSSLASNLSSVKSTLVGLAGAYVGAQGAAKAFESTLGAAAQYQQSEVAVKAIFNDDEASSAYLKMIDKMAIGSPLLNSSDMLSSSKTLVAMTKNVEDLSDAWSIIERLQVLDPTQGTDGAAFALKEMWQGDALSMVERFGLDKKQLNEIKKMSIPKQISEINKLLNGMGITQSTVEAMGSTTLGYWTQIGERAEKFGRMVGEAGNTKLSEVLGGIVSSLDNMDLDGIAQRIGDVLGGIVEKAISIGKFLWQWREPISYIVGALTAALGAFAVIGTLSLLASPISLIAAGIAGAAVGMTALYKNSETFRNAIGGIVGKVKELVSAFKTNGVEGLITQLLPPAVANVLISGLTKVSDFVATFRQVMEGGLFTGISSRDKGAVALAVGIANGIKNTITKVSDFILTFKQVMAGGLLTGILDRDKGAVQKAVALANGIKTVFGAVKDFITEKITQLQPTLSMLGTIFENVKNIVVTAFTTLWSVAGPILLAVWSALQILGDIAVLVFNNVIVPAFVFVTTAAQTMWSILGPILQLVGSAIALAFGVFKIVWDTILGPFLAFLAGAFTVGMDAATQVVSAIGSAFEKVGTFISTAAGYVKDFAGLLSKVKVPDWIGKIGGAAFNGVKGLISGKPDGSHYHGLDRVPYDGYVATLHRNEMILTANEAEQYRSLVTPNESLASVTTPQKSASNVINIPTQKMSAMEQPHIKNVFTPTINLPQIEAFAGGITNVFEPLINLPKIDAVVSSIDNVINFQTQEPSYSNVSYEDVSTGITNNNSTTNNSYSTTNQQGTAESTQPQRSISIAKLADHIVVREEADVDRIVDKMVSKLIEAEAAGV